MFKIVFIIFTHKILLKRPQKVFFSCLYPATWMLKATTFIKLLWIYINIKLKLSWSNNNFHKLDILFKLRDNFFYHWEPPSLAWNCGWHRLIKLNLFTWAYVAHKTENKVSSSSDISLTCCCCWCCYNNERIDNKNWQRIVALNHYKDDFEQKYACSEYQQTLSLFSCLRRLRRCFCYRCLL